MDLNGDILLSKMIGISETISTIGFNIASHTSSLDKDTDGFY